MKLCFSIGIFALILATVLNSCGTGLCVENCHCPLTKTASISPLYPTATNWLEFIKNDGSNTFNASGTRCDGTETGTRDICIHGAERKIMELPLESSCQGLGIRDERDQFTWHCDDSTGVVRVYMDGLKTFVGLAALIDSHQWQPNSVIVDRAGCAIYRTPSETWWSNPITPLPEDTTNITVLNSSGTIYFAANSFSTAGFSIEADEVALIVEAGERLDFANSTAVNCNSTDGTTTAPDARCFVTSASRKFFWLEGSYSGLSVSPAPDIGVLLVGNHRPTIFNLSMSSFTQNMLRFNNTSYGRFVNLGATITGETAIYFEGASDYNYLVNILLAIIGTTTAHHGIHISGSNNEITGPMIADGKGDGIRIDNGSSGNIIQGGRIFSVDQAGITISNSTENIIAASIFASNGTDGININTSSHRNTLAFLTTGNNATEGLVIDSSDSNTVFSYVGIGNLNEAIQLNNAGTGGGNVFEKTVTWSTASPHIEFAGTSTGNIFRDHLVFPSNGATDCNNAGGGAAPGLNSDCTNDAQSSATLHQSIDMSSSFVARVLTTDTVATNFLGYAPFGGILNWWGFENTNRTWGLVPAPPSNPSFPDSAYVGRCALATIHCGIWDWSHQAADTALINRAHNFTTENQAFTTGSACPAGTDGSITLTDTQGTPNTFLKNAYEVPLDGIGNDNILCESSETCFHAPNFGAYQGHGNFENSCIFNDGTVQDVTLINLESNGR